MHLSVDRKLRGSKWVVNFAHCNPHPVLSCGCPVASLSKFILFIFYLPVDRTKDGTRGEKKTVDEGYLGVRNVDNPIFLPLLSLNWPTGSS